MREEFLIQKPLDIFLSFTHYIYLLLAESSVCFHLFILDQRTGATIACTACTEPSLLLLPLLLQYCCPTHAVPWPQDVLKALLHVLHCGGRRY